MKNVTKSIKSVKSLDILTGGHLAGRSRGSRPLPFLNTVQIVPSSSSTNLEEALWKISFKNETIDQNDLPTALSWSFQCYFKKDTKTWFSPVRLIYSHSLLHNIISNRTGANSFFITLKIVSQTSAWLSVRIKRKRFIFNCVRLFYFKEKPTTLLRHEG